jgi:isopentenyl diphosphate isomerase/L-lactate dehydrogenase-like FMN-dependent dehydrogenase
LKAPRAHSIEELRAAARRRLPRVVFDYVDGGAEDCVTLRANREAFEAIRFAPRTLVDVSRRSQQVRLFGRGYDSPFGIAPLGASGLCWHDADVALARAAHAANVPFTLSTHSFVPVERVAREAGAAPWFQLYMPKDRAAAGAIVGRAFDAGCEVLVLTTDVPVGGNREHDERNGFCVPLRLGARTVLDGLRHPRWLTQVYFRSLRGRPIPRWGLRRDQADWHDFAWLRALWPRKLVVKGILTVEDAVLAREHGADGIVVSNHGGRQLDGAPATIEVLPRIAAALGGAIAILADGGFRRGADIVKALALGADMVLVGRPALYGAAAAGESGASRALHILKSEIDRVLALLGCPAVDELGPQHLMAPSARRLSDGRQRSAAGLLGVPRRLKRGKPSA